MDSGDQYNECLSSMKRSQRQSMAEATVKSPRERHRHRGRFHLLRDEDNVNTLEKMTQGRVIASMVPDEIILQPSSYSVRRYEIALLFIDISGFTDLCEKYTKADSGGPSRLTQVLNSYIGTVVQEILSHGGDVLNFSGDAILSMWKRSPRFSLQSIVHLAIDCGLSVQKNYGTYHTDVGVVLKVKIAISAGESLFSLIGDAIHSDYVILGQPVWDVKIAEYVARPGDVMTTASVWMYANEAEYITEPVGDGKHTKVLETGVSWKTVGHSFHHGKMQSLPSIDSTGDFDQNYCREFSLRPVIASAIRSSWWPSLRKFMAKPVMWAVENDEPMEFLTEIRRVVIVFLNIITNTVTDELLVDIVDTAFKCISSISSASGGLLNKVSMFDKDLMFLLVFGLRGMTHEDETQKSLLCAHALKESLLDTNIASVSIGITCGTTYCGVVGHVLRREYTVIGSAVNKAARLMITYPNKITCDKEIFLRSKMDQEFFRLLEYKPMKGIQKPGPVFEFNKYGWPERLNARRHPILGRNEQLRKYILTLQNAIKQQHQTFTRYRDHVYGVVFLGPTSVGKTRLMEECIYLTPNCIRVIRVSLTETDMMPYGLFRRIALKTLTGGSAIRDSCERKIRSSLDISALSPVQLYAINIMFGCRFPLPGDIELSGDILAEYSVKKVVRDIFRYHIPSLWIIAIEEATYIDDESWRLLLILLDAKTIFVIMTITDHTTMTDVARQCLSTNMLLKISVSGLEHWYHSALACQFLDVQAIPADLEKIIQSASNGMPGWIQNFIISLVQQGDLSIATETKAKALQKGEVVPPPSLLFRIADSTPELSENQISLDAYFNEVLESLNAGENEKSKSGSRVMAQAKDLIQIAVLSDTYEVLNVTMSMDAIILKTYDSLTPFEKVLLKCSSILGVVFSRRMMQYMLQCDSPRKIAEAVAKLFTIRVLECEGGDFTRETSKVMIRASPERQDTVHEAWPPHCSCLGTKQLADCDDLPKYAFCGYMRFRNPLFRTTTYELLTEIQKHEMHARALLYLEHYTRRCSYCGSGFFRKMMGKRANDGLIEESMELKNTRRIIQELAAETHHEAAKQARSKVSVELPFRSLLPLHYHADTLFRLRGEHEKLFEAYLEYADLCVMNSNTAQALRLLDEAEIYVLDDDSWSKVNSKIHWLKDFSLGRILSLRGGCMLEIGELVEARKHLYRALDLFCDQFPTTKYKQWIHNMQTSMRRWMAKAYVGTASGLAGFFYEEVALTLNRLYKLFTECKEYSNAELTARWSLHYARRSNANFQVLCECYGNMVTMHVNNQEFSECVALEKLAMEMCHRKRGLLDDAEMRAVCALYTSVFLFYVEYGKKNESLEFGLPVMHMVSKLPDTGNRVEVVIWVLRLLLSDLRIEEMVLLMRESLYLDGQYDLSPTTWYYCYSLVVLLETGYSVESYHVCERFYLNNGDTILRSKGIDAAWEYFACMWLITVRMNAWERSVFWEEKVKEIMSMEKNQIIYKLHLQLVLLEGLLIMLVREIDSLNINKIEVLEKTVKKMFETLRKSCQRAPIYLPRYFLLLAYFLYIRSKKFRARMYLEKTFALANNLAEGTVLIWAEHTRQHWTGTLDPALEHYWVEHVEPANLLDYRDFNNNKRIVPFTLPLPKNLDR